MICTVMRGNSRVAFSNLAETFVEKHILLSVLSIPTFCRQKINISLSKFFKIFRQNSIKIAISEKTWLNLLSLVILHLEMFVNHDGS